MTKYEIVEKKAGNVLVAGIRVKAKYEEMGRLFGEIAGKYGDIIVGTGMCLYYEIGFSEIADYEICFPVREKRECNGVNVREIIGGKYVSLTYKGKYENSESAWKSVFEYIGMKGYKPILPSREIYLVSPNETNNPEEYVTEIQVFYE